MSVALKPYLEYKDSGLPWLGDIPVNWQIIRTKHLFRLCTEKAPINNRFELLSIYTHIGVKPRKELEQRGNKASSTDEYWIVKRGDIIVNKLLAWMGAIGVSHYDGVTSPAYDILRGIRPLNPDFYHYLFRTGMYLREFKSRSTGIMEMRLRLYFDKFGQIPLIYPPLTDQTAIVQFLDHYERLVNQAIYSKRRFIELLNEQKQAIIHKAVTRGFDSNSQLKPSGIDWLGDVPEHWDVRKVKQVSHLLVSNVDKISLQNEMTIRLCNYTDVYNNEVISDEINFMVASATKDEIMKFRLKINDVVITKDSEMWNDIGVPALVTHEAPDLICGYHLAILRPDARKMIGEFLLRCFQDRLLATQLHIQANGVTRYGLSQHAIKDCLVPVPPVKDQSVICKILQAELLDLSTAKDKAMLEIDLLREYRTRLISDVVTGKLDVRNVELPAMNETEVMEYMDACEDTESEELIEN